MDSFNKSGFKQAQIIAHIQLQQFLLKNIKIHLTTQTIIIILILYIIEFMKKLAFALVNHNRSIVIIQKTARVLHNNTKLKCNKRLKATSRIPKLNS